MYTHGLLGKTDTDHWATLLPEHTKNINLIKIFVFFSSFVLKHFIVTQIILLLNCFTAITIQDQIDSDKLGVMNINYLRDGDN